jgi:hypothetical protein
MVGVVLTYLPKVRTVDRDLRNIPLHEISLHSWRHCSASLLQVEMTDNGDRAKSLPFLSFVNLISEICTPSFRKESLLALNYFIQPVALKNPLAPSGM